MHLVHRKMHAYVLAIAIGVVTAVLPFQSPAQEDDRSKEPSGGELLFDGVIVRPVMLLGTVVGTAAFVITLPFTIPADGVSEARQKFIVEPANYTFRRPFGDFEPRK